MPPRTEPLRRLVEGEQPVGVRVPSQERPDPAQERFVAGARELLRGLLLGKVQQYRCLSQSFLPSASDCLFAHAPLPSVASQSPHRSRKRDASNPTGSPRRSPAA